MYVCVRPTKADGNGGNNERFVHVNTTRSRVNNLHKQKAPYKNIEKELSDWLINTKRLNSSQWLICRLKRHTHVCLKRSALHWLIYCFDLNELQESTTHLAVLCSVRLLQLKYKIRCLHKQELFITMCALEPQAERNGRLIWVIV